MLVGCDQIVEVYGWEHKEGDKVSGEKMARCALEDE